MANDRLSVRDIAQKFSISKSTAQKRIAKGKLILLQKNVRAKAAVADQLTQKVAKLAGEVSRLKALVINLRRCLIVKTTQIFLLTIFKESVRQLFPRFKFSRFSAFEKKRILDHLAAFQRTKGKLSYFARDIGLSLQTLKRWCSAYKSYGITGLEDKKTRPKHFSHKLSSYLKKQIFLLFTKFPDFSPYQYVKYLKYNPFYNVSVSLLTIKKLHEQYIREKDWDKERRKKHWQFDPNYQAWTVDFTCLLKTPHYKLELLTVSDQRSRFLFDPILCIDATTELVVSHLENLFIKYGMPYLIKADNGQQFRLQCREDLNKLGVYLLNSPPYYARFSGAHERIHRTMKDFITEFKSHKNLTRLVSEIAQFCENYNHHWPHPWLSFKTPAQVLYTEPDSPVKDTEIVTPYKKQGELRFMFTNRYGEKTRMALPLLTNEASVT